MNITEKLTAIYENTSKVYDMGVSAGKQAENNSLWEQLQNGGKATRYAWAFSYSLFSDETYNPKYDIKCSEVANAGQNVFYNSILTDTKVAIHANSLNINGMFYWARNLKTVRKLVVIETTTFSTAFNECFALENITFDGVIGQDINLRWSPLTRASIESVVSHVSDSASGKTASFKEDAVLAAFGTLDEWEAYISSKPNWTFTLQ